MRQLKEVSDAVLARAGRFHPVADNLEVKEVMVDGRRYVVCRNPDEARKDAGRAPRSWRNSKRCSRMGPRQSSATGLRALRPRAEGSVSIDPAAVRVKFVRMERPEVSDIDLSSADVIVSAGRGIQKKENLRIVEEFAKAIGGVVGASRPLTDMEWLPKTRQVGQSGKTVKPKLYVACGISGAMQHIAGMKDAGLIIAINTDPTAPIFEVAHVGFVANVLELLPAVIKELKGG